MLPQQFQATKGNWINTRKELWEIRQEIDSLLIPLESIKRLLWGTLCVFKTNRIDISFVLFAIFIWISRHCCHRTGIPTVISLKMTGKKKRKTGKWLFSGDLRFFVLGRKLFEKIVPLFILKLHPFRLFLAIKVNFRSQEKKMQRKMILSSLFLYYLPLCSHWILCHTWSAWWSM